AGEGGGGGVGGVGLALGCGWMSLAIPGGEPLAAHRRRSFVFSYGHFLIFAPLAAMGAGLHVAAFGLEDKASIGTTAIVLTVVIPVSIYALALYGLYSVLMRTADPFHLILLAATAVILVAAVRLAAGGGGVPACLLVVMLAPVVTVVGYETIGHRHIAQALDQL